jgi:hypothetical protein
VTVTTTPTVEMVDRIRDTVVSGRAADHLRIYFHGSTVDRRGSKPQAGRWFDRLGGGGDRPAVANVVTADDLVAVALLNVRIRPRVAVGLLIEQSDRLTELLRQIPTDLDLRDAEDEVLAASAPLCRAWRLLREGPGDKPADRWVTAGKLLARKRPRLVPSYDRVVREMIAGPRHLWWLTARTAMRDPEVSDALTRLRCEAQVPAVVADLRLLDVVLWMEGSRRGLQNGIVEE